MALQPETPPTPGVVAAGRRCERLRREKASPKRPPICGLPVAIVPVVIVVRSRATLLMQLLMVSWLVSLFSVVVSSQLDSPDSFDVSDETATSSAIPELIGNTSSDGTFKAAAAATDNTADTTADDDTMAKSLPPQPQSSIIRRRGQHLLLVPRGSRHALQLEAVTAYRLRQSQQALRIKDDTRDSVPVNMDGNMVDVKLPQVARDELAETESTTKRPANQTKSLVGSSSPVIAATTTTTAAAAASSSNENTRSHHQNEEDEFETIPLLLTGLHNGMVIMSRSHRQDEDGLVRYYEKEKAAKRGGFMMLGNGQDARFRYIDLSVGEMDSEGTGSGMGKDKVVHVRLWNTKQQGVSSSSSSSSLPHECWSRHQFQLQSMRNTTVVNRTTTVIFMSETVQAGAPVVLGWSPNFLNENEQCTPVLGVNVGAASHQRWQFVIHADGSISPIGAEHLVIGLAPHPELMLVHRQGQNRASTSNSSSSTTNDTTGSGTAFAAATTTSQSTQTLFFHNIHTLWSQNPAPAHGTPMRLSLSPQSTTTVDGNGAVSANDHDSHSLVPLYSVGNTSSYNAFGIWDMQRLGVSSSAIHATEEEKSVIYLHALAHRQPFEFVLHDNDGRLLVPLSLHVERGVPVRLIKYNGSAITVFQNTDLGRMLDTAVLAWSGNATWIVHDDGSISPRNAPYLALGCACGSSTRTSSKSSSMRLSPVSNTSRLAAAETTTTDEAAQRAQQLERLYAAGILSRQHPSEGSFSNSNHHSEYHNETYRARNSRAMALFVKHALQPQVLLALHELLALFGTNWTAASGSDSSSTSSESGSSSRGGSGSSSGSTTSATTTDDSVAHVGYVIMWFVSLMGVVLTLLAIKRIPWILWGIPLVWIWFGAKFVVAYLSGVCAVWCYTAYKRRRTKRSRLVAPTVALQGVLPPAVAPAADNEVDLRLLE